MWTLCAILMLSACFVVQCTAFQCEEAILQEEVNFDKISGSWGQAFYSPGSIYDQVTCAESNIFGVDKEAKTFNMQTKVLLYDDAGNTIPHTILSTANWGGVSFGNEVSVKDHIATDYETYLIFYLCKNGESFIDINLRKGVTRLPLQKIREVAGKLEKIGVDFFSMVERPQTGCKVE